MMKRKVLKNMVYVKKFLSASGTQGFLAIFRMRNSNNKTFILKFHAYDVNIKKTIRTRLLMKNETTGFYKKITYGRTNPFF